MESSGVTVSDMKLSVKHLKVPATYYDRTGHFPLWKIPRLYQDTGFLVIRAGFMDSHIFPGKQGTAFTLREKTRINTNVLRNMTMSKRLHYTLNQEFVAVGNSTNISKGSIFIDETGELLCEKYVKNINVDFQTRRPIEYPSWFKDKYKNGFRHTGLERASSLEPPENCFRTSTKIRSNDSDQNGHLTVAMYYSFIIDCATAASTSGYYQQFSLDMAWYPVRDIDIAFLGECWVNETLDICTWQEKDNIENIYFVFFVNGKRVLQASLVFETTPHDETPDAKL